VGPEKKSLTTRIPALHPFYWLGKFGWDAARLPKKLFLVQPMMMKVVQALVPLVLAAVFFFGLRAFLVCAVCLLAGILAEAFFTIPAKKPVTSAIFVTALIFALSLPPSIPLWMAALGMVFGTLFAKMAFGGFGHNVYNPAMAGRAFIYIAFPAALTGQWRAPAEGIPGGLALWSVDAVTSATPLARFAAGEDVSLAPLFWGNVSGSLGETSAFLILLGGAWLLATKTAPWRIALSFFLGGLLASALLFWLKIPGVPGPLPFLLAGSFLFGCFFVATEPLSAPRIKEVHWVYGGLMGALVPVLRAYSNFPEGVMFATLFMNTFAPLMDQTARMLKERGKAQ
jgi:Na+-transporting NADH:ubiquinone oxidoreductase subunit B